MFEDPLFGVIWSIQILFIFLLFLSMVAFVVYYWRLARKRDRESEQKNRSRHTDNK
jgi:membrane protein implicated in regulation of membrane protease activity